MKGKKITAAFLSLAMIAGVPAAVLAEKPNETAGVFGGMREVANR